MAVVDRPASVSNLIIKSAEMERDGNLKCGILASSSHPNATISDVVVQGTIESTGSGAHSIVVGGAVGEYRGTATDLKVIVDINVVDAGTTASVGGAIGTVGGAEIKEITYSSYNGSITMPTGQFSHSAKIGGFTSQLSGNGISKCFAHVNNTIVANAANFISAGGFVAYVSDDPSELDNCYAFADIGYCQSGANNAKVGGFIGYIDGGGSIGLKHAYCVGAIDVGNDEYGGFCGVNDGYGGFNSCFYDYGRAGTRTSDGGTWKTQAEMKTK
ncbi:hypothetical protein, partial [Neptuniibacter sp.]|uniref:hypothetical protein n=1 Tax=Neptuniibacter sp. TaxID=1962643 RepID=UPI002606D1E3